MRSLIVGVAAFLALAVPTIASADTGGSIKITWASVDGDEQRSYNGEDIAARYYDYGNTADNVLALGGHVITDVSDNWRVQFNATSSDTDVQAYYGQGYSVSHSQVEVHATYNTGNFDVGGFTGMFNNDGHTFYEYGVEGGANFGRARVTVSAAGATSANSDFYDDITTVAAQGSFMLTENLSVGATLSNTNFGSYGNGGFYEDDAEVTSYGVNVGYNIGDWTIAAGYRSADTDFGDTEFLGLSLAWNFGEGARGREMPGASALIPDAIATLDNFFVT